MALTAKRVRLKLFYNIIQLTMEAEQAIQRWYGANPKVSSLRMGGGYIESAA